MCTPLRTGDIIVRAPGGNFETSIVKDIADGPGVNFVTVTRLDDSTFVMSKWAVFVLLRKGAQIELSE